MGVAELEGVIGEGTKIGKIEGGRAW